jgi:hypothetical protein
MDARVSAEKPCGALIVTLRSVYGISSAQSDNPTRVPTAEGKASVFKKVQSVFREFDRGH